MFTLAEYEEAKSKITPKDGGGIFMNTDGIPYELDASGMAKHLKSIGVGVTRYYDKRTCGIVETKDGYCISSNGYMYKK